jgi:DNA-binding FadR family transcriptional regulator
VHKIVSNLCRLEEGDLLGYSDGNAALHAAIIEAIAAHDEETAEKPCGSISARSNRR